MVVQKVLITKSKSSKEMLSDLGILKTLEPESFIAVTNISEINHLLQQRLFLCCSKLSLQLIP